MQLKNKAVVFKRLFPIKVCQREHSQGELGFTYATGLQHKNYVMGTGNVARI